MRAVLCNLMVAVMTVPTLLGWCCHPCFDQQNYRDTLDACTHSCCCDQHGDEAQQPVPDDSCSHCKGVCTYVLTSKLTVQRSNFASAIFTPSATLELGNPSCEQAASFLHSDQLASALQPLRLHAIHQLWLI